MNKLTLDELKILLALYGNIRTEILESEVFASDDEVILYYINTCLYRAAFPNSVMAEPGISTIERAPAVLYFYAARVLRSRYVVAESIFNRVNTNMWSAYYFAEFVNKE